MAQDIAREEMEYDVVIVGAGPSGLSAAIRLKQLDANLSVVVLEKGSEVGAHILSGAVLDPSGLDALLPEWRTMGAPISLESIHGVAKDRGLAKFDFDVELEKIEEEDANRALRMAALPQPPEPPAPSPAPTPAGSPAPAPGGPRRPAAGAE